MRLHLQEAWLVLDLEFPVNEQHKKNEMGTGVSSPSFLPL